MRKAKPTSKQPRVGAAAAEWRRPLHVPQVLPRDEATFGFVNEANKTKSGSSLCHKDLAYIFRQVVYGEAAVRSQVPPR
uniref:Uncharacterized protein n=1 Tax=Oryza meridionalis TaxID=40149 RepID=A0A0E0EDU9_9ORYZ